MANASVKSGAGRGSKSGTRARGRDTESYSQPFHVSGDASVSTTRNALRELGLGPDPRSGESVEGAPHFAAQDRPRTSSGGDRLPGKKQHVDKPKTKDDLHFNASSTQEVVRTHFNFPLPSSSPRPSPLSISSKIASPLPPEGKSPAVTGLGISNSNTMPGEIGMALGSPSQGNFATAWSAGRNDSPESMDSIIESREFDTQPKLKPKKWKLLGLFGKKTSEPAQPFYQISPLEVAQDQLNFAPPSPPPSAGLRGRGKTVSERTTTPKVGIQRANTVPVQPLSFDFDEATSPPAPTPPKKDAPEIKIEGGPFLDVEIPRIEMERYSVMFGSFLKATPAQRQSGALLARRQATLDKLKTVNDEIAEFERREAETKQRLLHPRRATSPQPSMTGKSPAFSLFPRTPNDSSPSIPRRSPLQRSNTSPAALSPNRQTFAQKSPSQRSEEHIIMLQQSPEIGATLSSPWSADECHLILDSPGADEVHDTMPLKPALAEPEWEMLPRPVAQDDSTTPLTLPRSKFAIPPRPSTSHGTSKSTSSFARPSTSNGPSHAKSSSSAAPAASNISFSTPNRTHPRNNKSLNSNPVHHPHHHHHNPPTTDTSSTASTTTTHRRPTRNDSGVSVSFSPKTSISLPSHPHPNPHPHTQPSVDETDAEALIRSAAEQSIARQISISRQQREMLIPIQARIAQAAGNGRGEKADRVVVNEKRGGLVPVLVDVGGGSGGEGKDKERGRVAGGKGHVHKKSERGVIEGV